MKAMEGGGGGGGGEERMLCVALSAFSNASVQD